MTCTLCNIHKTCAALGTLPVQKHWKIAYKAFKSSIFPISNSSRLIFINLKYFSGRKVLLYFIYE